MSLNVARFRQIQEIIREEPRRFEMSQWVQTQTRHDVVQTIAGPLPSDLWEFPDCGTVCCLAGWDQTLVRMERGNNMQQAAKFVENDAFLTGSLAMFDLGLKTKCLFFVGGWPQPFQSDYNKAIAEKDYRLSTHIACSLIDHVIEHAEEWEAPEPKRKG